MLTDAVIALTQQDAANAQRETRKTVALVWLTGLVVVLTLVLVGLTVVLVAHL